MKERNNNTALLVCHRPEETVYSYCLTPFLQPFELYIQAIVKMKKLGLSQREGKGLGDYVVGK